MPFSVIDIKETIEEKRNKDILFRESWDDSREEYRLIGEMISLRKQEHITQSKLAELTGKKQQVISRIEKKEQKTSLGLFCHILNALGYELKIVKKSNSKTL